MTDQTTIKDNASGQCASTAGLDINNVLAILKAQTAKNIDPLSSYANAILDFYNLDYGWHRFQIHTHVFKGMDIAEYLKSMSNVKVRGCALAQSRLTARLGCVSFATFPKEFCNPKHTHTYHD